MNFYIYLYFFILGTCLFYKNTVLIITTIILGILILSLIPIYRKKRMENAKKAIENLQNPSVNVNKEPFYIIQQLPGFNKVSAKKAVWIRKKNGKYLSKEDFFVKNNIKNKEEIEKLIII